MAQKTIAGGEGIKSIPSIDDLMAVVTDLENKKKDGIQRTIILEKDIKVRTEERDTFKALSQKLEKENEELKGKVKLNITETQEVNVMKEKSEEILTRAKSIIFEKTKVCKNQELQIEALSQQVVSLKEVVSITKDLLEIRNMEVKHLQDQINIMSEKVEAEKQRQDIIHTKLDKMVSLNTELKGEYEMQLCLFNALRQRYNENELAKGIVPKPAQVPSAETDTETNNPEVTEGIQEKSPVQNGVVQTEITVAPEPNKTVKDTEVLIPEQVITVNGDQSTEPSTSETSDVESVGLSTIEENSSSAEQS